MSDAVQLAEYRPLRGALAPLNPATLHDIHEHLDEVLGRIFLAIGRACGPAVCVDHGLLPPMASLSSACAIDCVNREFLA